MGHTTIRGLMELRILWKQRETVESCDMPSDSYHGHDPTRHRGPAYSFGMRYWADNREWASPGPAAYNIEYMSRYGKHRIPTAHISGWSPNLVNYEGPGPGAYNPEPCFDFTKPTAPKFTFGKRTREAITTGGPAPNAYNIPELLCKSFDSKYPTAPRAYIAGKRPDPTIMSQAPGPGHYKIVNPDVYKPRAPQHSLSFRHDQYADAGGAPGPGAYSPERVWMHKHTAPSYSFGIRHSPHVGNVTEILSKQQQQD